VTGEAAFEVATLIRSLLAVEPTRPILSAMALKAAELHRLARIELGPALEGLGFRRLPKSSVAAWLRAEGDRWVMLHVQASTSNSAADGFAFTVELRLTREPVLYAVGRPMIRLPKLMTDDQRERLRHVENRVIAKLPAPDPGILAALGSGEARDAYLDRRKPRLEPYDRERDIWFRYLDANDAIEDLELCQEALPAAIASFLERQKTPTG
jgi:hypothetical protein